MEAARAKGTHDLDVSWEGWCSDAGHTRPMLRQESKYGNSEFQESKYGNSEFSRCTISIARCTINKAPKWYIEKIWKVRFLMYCQCISDNGKYIPIRLSRYMSRQHGNRQTQLPGTTSEARAHADPRSPAPNTRASLPRLPPGAACTRPVESHCRRSLLARRKNTSVTTSMPGLLDFRWAGKT